MSTLYRDRPISEPIRHPESEPFYNGAADGKFLIRRSKADGRPHWYPRAICPFTQSDTEWCEAAGKGTIYSVSVTRRSGTTPFAIAYVTLDEGVTMLTNIVDCDLDALKIGDRVKVVFKHAESGSAIPMFTPE